MTSVHSASHPPTLASFSFDLPQQPERPAKRTRDEDDDDDNDLHPATFYAPYVNPPTGQQQLPSTSHADEYGVDGEEDVGLDADDVLEGNEDEG